MYILPKIEGVGRSVDKMSKICYIIGVKDIKVSKSIKKEIVIWKISNITVFGKFPHVFLGGKNLNSPRKAHEPKTDRQTAYALLCLPRILFVGVDALGDPHTLTRIFKL